MTMIQYRHCLRIETSVPFFPHQYCRVISASYESYHRVSDETVRKHESSKFKQDTMHGKSFKGRTFEVIRRRIGDFTIFHGS